MSRQLLEEVLQGAEKTAPGVQAAAFSHAARVMAVFDREESVRLLERGITLAKALPEKERALFMPEIAALAAAVSPRRAIDLASALDDDGTSEIRERLVITMLDHGHSSEAARYLSTPHNANGFPFTGLESAIGQCRDPEAQQAMLRTAIDSFRNSTTPMDRHRLFGVFNRYWKVLPTEEAAGLVREFVSGIAREPDERWSQSYSFPNKKPVRFRSSQQCQIFSLLGPLRRLDPQLTESLIAKYSELGSAAEVFPYGIEEAAMDPANAPPSPEPKLPGGPIEWDFEKLQWVSTADWMKTCWEDMFKGAERKLRLDTAERNPNRAPLEIWPSTQEFRNLMYKAGRYESRDGIARLERISHAEIRFLAKIELLAGMLGLPQLGFREMPPQPPEHESSPELENLVALNLASLPIRWEGCGQPSWVETRAANWDATRNDKASDRYVEVATFRPDGRLLEKKAEASGIRCSYDNSGQLVEVDRIRNGEVTKYACQYNVDGRLIEVAEKGSSELPEQGGMDWTAFGGAMTSCVTSRVSPEGYAVLDAVSMKTSYDPLGRAIEFSYFGANQIPLGQVQLVWNTAGLKERETFVVELPFEFDTDLDAPPRTSLSFKYDDRGRCVELSMNPGDKDRKTTFLYDDHDSLVELNSEWEHQRFEYQYDAEGNWVERVTWNWSEPLGEYRQTTIERRTITYANTEGA